MKCCLLWLLLALPMAAAAQDLGDAHIQKISPGVYVYVGDHLDSNCGIVLTQEGVVLIDTGHYPTDSRAVLAAIKRLTDLPVKFVVDTEPHPDHTAGHFLFSPPAVIVARQGAGESMTRFAHEHPERNPDLAAHSPLMGEALQDYRLVLPDLEYQESCTLHVGERIFEVFYLNSVHSEADSAVWLPREKVLFAGAAATVRQWNNMRDFVRIDDILAATTRMEALHPEVVVASHGPPGTVQILADSKLFYRRLLERSGRLLREGKSVTQISKELKMPEYSEWANPERIPSNVQAACRAAKP